MDQFWLNCKPKKKKKKKTLAHMFQKIQEFGKNPTEKNQNTQSHFDQSGVLKDR